jgi:hypothetical protein
MKLIASLILSLFFATNVNAYTIEMFGKDTYGFDMPRYRDETINDIEILRGLRLAIIAIADEDNFPVSSYEQGSIFNKIFENLKEEYGIKIIITPLSKGFQNQVLHMERGGKIESQWDTSGHHINAIFGAPYKEHIYSRNKEIYPAFFVNNVHIITSAQTKLDLKERNDLKKYKGIYVKQDRIADNILNDFANLGINSVDNYNEAYKQLLTGEIDFIAASYYPSLLESYKQGIRNYVTYSKNPVWKMPLFIRVRPEVLRNKHVEDLSDYLKSSQYRKAVKETLDELVDIYRKNTEGIVPPTYTREISSSEQENENPTEDEQKLEN